MKLEKVKKITKISTPSKRYDIEVKDHHNYFANNILVHNCTSMYQDRIHARSVDSVSHPSQAWARNHWGKISYLIPDGWRVICENVYALHSIYYRNLDHYLYVIGIYDDRNVCLSWEDTKIYAELIDLPTVPVIYEGRWNEKLIREYWTGRSKFDTYTEASARKMWAKEPRVPLPTYWIEPSSRKDSEIEFFDNYPHRQEISLEPTTGEGYVVRLAGEFDYDQFSTAVSKYVRKNHVTTSKFWKTEEIVPNGIVEKNHEQGQGDH